jgi:excisionase family DNA binding protein
MFCMMESDVSISVGAMLLPQLLSPEQASEYLGISAYTIRQRLKKGEIPGRKHGARWLIRVVDLIQYVEPNNFK